MIKFDLTSAYHFIEIFESHRKFLGFSWKNKQGKMAYYTFCVLPFGLSSAGYIFTKLCRPLVAKWRGEGKFVSMFLDDGFGCNKNKDLTEILGVQVKQDILLSGFIPNASKSVWIPVQLIEYLGVLLNSELGELYIPERRLSKAFDTLSGIMLDIKKHRRVSARKLASFVGQIISMSIVIGYIAQIMSKFISIDILKAKHWDFFVSLSGDSIEQLKFWRESLRLINSKKMFDIQTCSKMVFSDASSTGYGGYEVSTLNGTVHGEWTAEETSKSSTWRELVAVHRVLRSLGYVLKHHRVKWFTDNQAVHSIVKKGSMKLELQNIALDIFKTCMSLSVILDLEWLPRSENERADYISKIVDYDDWGISWQLFEIVCQRFGRPSVDWFASQHNAKLPLFYSRFWSPSSAGVDAFAEDWSKTFGLFVPPISMVCRVICKMQHERVHGILIIPLWRSSAFWPIICPNGQFISAVIDWIDLPADRSFYVRSKNGPGLFGNVDLQFRMLALRVKF